jgi:hypothetical protein
LSRHFCAKDICGAATSRISRIKSTPAADLSTVQAPDAEAAIKAAIEQFGIKNPQHQQRLVARRIAQ